MKRSEMVKLIGDELYRILPSELCKYADSDADMILRLIEEEGMLPPEHFQTPIKDTVYVHASDCLYKDGKYGIFINEWEPEDE